MQSQFPTRSLSPLLPLVVVVAGCFLWLACSKPKPGLKHGAASASAVGSAAPLTAAKARDVCEHAAEPCACAAEQGGKLLTASFPERALQVMSRAPASCTSAALLGPRAEALAAVERGAEATALATSVLTQDAQNRFARRALAITALQRSEFGTADAILSKLVSEDDKDAASLFYVALIQRKGDHYNRAREGFLHVLRISPLYVDARYNLVTLTASAGAAQEAEHHYQELLQVAPVGDPRLIAARTALHQEGPNGPTELPVLHRSSAPIPSVSAAPAVLPSR